jgi:hypothetical protein
VDIPPESLPPETLRAIIEEFVTREGTDYGHALYSLDEKVARVEAQLARGDARIQFDPDTETVTLIPV